LVGDASLMGQMLNIIIGYSAQPNYLQVIFYVSTLLMIRIFAYIKIKFYKDA
jgi:high-affinity Fe2+/Pb2+ permease